MTKLYSVLLKTRFFSFIYSFNFFLIIILCFIRYKINDVMWFKAFVDFFFSVSQIIIFKNCWMKNPFNTVCTYIVPQKLKSEKSQSWNEREEGLLKKKKENQFNFFCVRYNSSAGIKWNFKKIFELSIWTCIIFHHLWCAHWTRISSTFMLYVEYFAYSYTSNIIFFEKCTL